MERDRRGRQSYPRSSLKATTTTSKYVSTRLLTSGEAQSHSNLQQLHRNQHSIDASTDPRHQKERGKAECQFDQENKVDLSDCCCDILRSFGYTFRPNRVGGIDPRYLQLSHLCICTSVSYSRRIQETNSATGHSFPRNQSSTPSTLSFWLSIQILDLGKRIILHCLLVASRLILGRASLNIAKGPLDRRR
jgi:hypothetical protein